MLSNKLKIFVEQDIFSEESYEDIIGKYFEVIPLTKEDIVFHRYNIKDTYLFRGSINLGQRLKYDYKWTDCVKWMPPLKKYLLNNNYLFLDAQTIADNWYGLNRYFQIMSGSDLFVRSSSGTKIFSGGIFSEERFKRELCFMKAGQNIDPYFLCTVAEPRRSIDNEYRCVFIDTKFVDACQYMKDGELLVDRIPDDEFNLIKEKAEEIVKNDLFQENIDFVLDIAKCGKSLYLVEINSFCSSSFYACDLDKIYKTWSESLVF